MKTQIIIIDFGSQVTKLIARRIREIDVFCEVIPFNNIEKEFKSKIINSKGIIFSGGPSSVYSKDAPLLGEKIFKLGIPILGICYGFQLICDFFKGKVKKSNGFAYAWFLREHSKPVAGIKSFVMLAKIDCSNVTFKQIWHFGFHGPRATGKHVRLPELGWVKPRRNGTNEKVIKNACFEIV